MTQYHAKDRDNNPLTLTIRDGRVSLASGRYSNPTCLSSITKVGVGFEAKCEKMKKAALAGLDEINEISYFEFS